VGRIYQLASSQDDLYARLVTGHAAVCSGARWSMVDVPAPGPGRREAVLAVAAGEDAVWFGGFGSVSRYDASGWSLFTPENSDFPGSGICSNALAADRRGMLWYLSRKSAFTASGLGSFNGTSWRERGRDDGFPFTMAGTPLIAGPDDRIWFGTPRGVCYWALGQFHTVGDDVCRALGDLATGAALDPDGRLWLATYGSGLVARLPDEPTVYRQADGLPSDRLTALAFDVEGHLWLAAAGGVFRFRDARWGESEQFTPADGLAGPLVHCLHAHGKGVWAVSGGSLASLDLKLSRLLGRVLVGVSRLVHPRPYQ
jgi:ligand-binding sensor domain-containing protein